MYYTGLDPFTLEPVYVTKDYNEKRMQRALLQASRPENRELVAKAIKLSGRNDAKSLLPHFSGSFEHHRATHGADKGKSTHKRGTDKRGNARNSEKTYKNGSGKSRDSGKDAQRTKTSSSPGRSKPHL